MRYVDDVLAAHHRLSRMNFILSGYTILAEVCDA